MNVFEGYREMTVDQILNNPDIEAVAVETEEIYLTKYAVMVANAGKHLHMEKPALSQPPNIIPGVRLLKYMLILANPNISRLTPIHI